MSRPKGETSEVELREAAYSKVSDTSPDGAIAANNSNKITSDPIRTQVKKPSLWEQFTFENIFGIEWGKARKSIWVFMDSPYTQLFLVTLLLLSLYITDAWILGNQPDSNDGVLDGILTSVFVIFLVEVIILTAVEPGYQFSFFFFMDILGTLSIILDIGFMSRSFLPDGTQASGSILRATRTAKLGARYGRLMRILKLIKFIQYIPCLSKKEVTDPEPSANSLRRVTSELSNVISQGVAGLVMIIVIVVPFLSYNTDDFSTDAWMKNIKYLAKDGTGTTAEMTKLTDSFKNFYKNKDIQVVSVSVESPHSAMNNFKRHWTQTDTLRGNNQVSFDLHYSDPSRSANDPNAKQYNIVAAMNYTTPNQYDAACGVILVTMVIIILVSFSASFQSQVELLVVAPLEKMLSTLRSSATVMLKNMNAIEKETKKDENDGNDSDDDDGEMETLMLEKMVEKLTRIIKLTYPGANDLDVSDNVDSKTASWLQETYSNTKKKDINDWQFAIDEHEDDIIEDTDPMHEIELRRQEIVVKKFATQIRDIEKLQTWDFDVLAYTRDELFTVMSYVFTQLNLFDDFHINPDVFHHFLVAVAGNYCENEYHNFHHGMDVCYTVYRLMMDSRVHLCFSQLEIFAILTAALAHDIGHPGVNNVYLVKAKHSFALRHNDRSPLENMHCALVYEILTANNTNIFRTLTEDQWRESRKVILTAILGTDMSHHFEQISKTQLFAEVNKQDVHSFCEGSQDEISCLSEEKDRHFILELCLHCADVSNPYKPFALCEKWSKLVSEEFSLQGDREKAEGLEVSPMCDRNAINLCNMQMGFIEFVVAPLVTAVVQLFYPLHIIGDNLCQNYLRWGERRKEDIYSDNAVADKEEETAKISTRMKAFEEKFAFLSDLAERPVRAQTNRAKLHLSNKNTRDSHLKDSKRGKPIYHLGVGGAIVQSQTRVKTVLGRDSGNSSEDDNTSD